MCFCIIFQTCLPSSFPHPTILPSLLTFSLKYKVNMATFSKHHLTDTFLYHLPIMSASFTHHIIRTHISKLAFVFFDQCKVILIHKKSTESFKGQHPRASMLTPWLMSLQHATNIFHFMIQAVAAFSYESHMFDTTYMTITT